MVCLEFNLEHISRLVQRHKRSANNSLNALRECVFWTQTINRALAGRKPW